jgi:galactokinase
VSNHEEICSGWKIVFRHPGALVSAFLVGGVLAFGYSYVPLHGAKNWKIDYQESRLEGQREKLEELKAKLVAAEALAKRASALEQQVPRREELEKALAKLEALEAKHSALGKANKKLTRDRNTWQSRHAEAEAERDEWKTRSVEAQAAAKVPEPAEEEPAAHAADSLALDPVEAMVLEGARWVSPDGAASFTLVEAAENRATLRLGQGSADTQAAFGDGRSIRVEAGSKVQIGDPAQRSYRVTIVEIDAGRSISINAVPETRDLRVAPLGSAAAAPAP